MTIDLDYITIKMIMFSIYFCASPDEARHRNESSYSNSIMENKASDERMSEHSKAKEDLKTERLSPGFPDEEEAIQLGLIVPDDSLGCQHESTSDLVEKQYSHSVKKENFNVNIKQQGDSSDVEVVELKNYTQVENTTKEFKSERVISSVPNKLNDDFEENGLEQKEFDLNKLCKEETKTPPLTKNIYSKQSISSPNTSCSQSDKLNNAEDKMNEDKGKAREEGIIVNPSCCQDKLLSGYCSYSQKNINEVPKNVKHRRYIKNFQI